MDIVEYALKLRDYASGQMKQFGQTTRRTFNQAERYTDNLNRHNSTLGLSYSELQHKIKQVENTIRHSTIPNQIREARIELRRLQQQASTHPGGAKISRGKMSGGAGASGGKMGGMAGMAGMALTGAAIGGLYAAGRLIVDGIQESFERQMVQTSFNVLTGSVKQGEALTKELVDLQQQTILGAKVFENAQTMMGFGFKDTEVIDNLKMLGDVSMGDAQRLDSLTLAYSQVRAAGRLTGQDLLQFINAGFNPLQEIAEKTGKTIGELKDEVSAGKISFEMVEQSFIDATSEGGKFNNMLEQIAETPAGKMQQLAGAWTEMKIKLGATFEPVVKMMLDMANKLMPMLEPLMNFISENVNKVSSVITNINVDTKGFADYIKIVKGLFEQHIIPYAITLFEFIVKTVSKIGEFVGKSELIKDVFKGVYSYVGFIYDVFKFVIEKIEWLLDHAILPLANIVDKAYTLITGSSTPGAGGNAFKSIFDQRRTIIMNNKETEPKVEGDDDLGLLDLIDGNNNSGTATENTITGGGPKVVNIQVGKFMEDLNISSINLTETAEEIEQVFMELFARVTVNGATVV